MAKLEKEHQEFIIECFARYLPPREIITQVKDTFNIDVTQQDLYHYNPKHKNALSKELREYFAQCREQYNKDTQSIGGGSKSFRVEQLTEIFFKLRDSKQYKLALEVIKQLEEMDKAQQGGQEHIGKAVNDLIAAYALSRQDPSHSQDTKESEEPTETIDPQENLNTNGSS